MSLAALRLAIVAAAEGHDLPVYPTEDTAAIVPCIVVGWPTSTTSEFGFAPGSTREVDLAIAVYIGVQAGEAEAFTALDALVDGPLIGDIADALAPHGTVVDLGQVSPVTVAGAHALRIPINVHALI
jgi:hypothetical protein